MTDGGQNSAVDVDSWIRGVLRDRTRRARGIVHQRIDDPTQPTRLIVDIGGRGINLGVVPAGWEIELACAPDGACPREVSVFADVPPARMIISAWPTLKTIKLNPDSGSDEWAGAVEFGLVAAGAVDLDVRQVLTPHLVVVNGTVALLAKAQPLRVDLDNASIEGVKRISGELTLQGTVQLPPGLQSVKTRLASKEVTIEATPSQRSKATNQESPPVRLGVIEGTNSDSCRLRVATRIIAKSVPADTEVFVDHGASLQATGAVGGIDIHGEGSVHIASGSRVGFDAEDSLELVMGPGNAIEDASGRVPSIRIREATITGARNSPLAPRRIVDAEGAELDRLDLTEIESIASIQTLRSAHRVVPAMPTAFDELTSIAETKPPGMTAEARQVYWAQLTDLVAEKKAPGATQSALRFVSAHARFTAAPKRSRESFWLWAYGSVGYGERITRPLTIYLLASTLVFLSVVFGLAGLQPASGSDVDPRLWWDLLVLPLSFFRLAGDSVISGGWLADVFTLILRVGGVLMVFFSLAAVRRLTKAE